MAADAVGTAARHVNSSACAAATALCNSDIVRCKSAALFARRAVSTRVLAASTIASALHMRPGGAWLSPLFDRFDPFVSRFGPHINRRTTENIFAAGLWIEREENLLSDIVKLIVARR